LEKTKMAGSSQRRGGCGAAEIFCVIGATPGVSLAMLQSNNLLRVAAVFSIREPFANGKDAGRRANLWPGLTGVFAQTELGLK
jgi:hypothetical protein